MFEWAVGRAMLHFPYDFRCGVTWERAWLGLAATRDRYSHKLAYSDVDRTLIDEKHMYSELVTLTNGIAMPAQ